MSHIRFSCNNITLIQYQQFLACLHKQFHTHVFDRWLLLSTKHDQTKICNAITGITANWQINTSRTVEGHIDILLSCVFVHESESIGTNAPVLVEFQGNNIQNLVDVGIYSMKLFMQVHDSHYLVLTSLMLENLNITHH